METNKQWLRSASSRRNDKLIRASTYPQMQPALCCSEVLTRTFNHLSIQNMIHK